MCFLWLCPEASNFMKNTNSEYTHQILGGDDIEPTNSENQNYMQIITSFLYFLFIIFLTFFFT